MASQPQKNDAAEAEAKSGCLYVKVSMEGAPYLRKVDLNSFTTYKDLSLALEKMFSCFTISKYSFRHLIYHLLPSISVFWHLLINIRGDCSNNPSFFFFLLGLNLRLHVYYLNP